MSRIARVVLEGVPHHITQRGNGRQVVFDNAGGRRLYLDLLKQNCEQYQLAIWAYCLMDNHVHLVAVPGRSDSLSRALGRTHADYARYPMPRVGVVVTFGRPASSHAHSDIRTLGTPCFTWSPTPCGQG